MRASALSYLILVPSLRDAPKGASPSAPTPKQQIKPPRWLRGVEPPMPQGFISEQTRSRGRAAPGVTAPQGHLWALGDVTHTAGSSKALEAEPPAPSSGGLQVCSSGPNEVKPPRTPRWDFWGWADRGRRVNPSPPPHRPPSPVSLVPLELFLIPNLISFDILIAGLTSLLESCAA